MSTAGDIAEVYEDAIAIGKAEGRKPGDDIGDIVFRLLTERKKTVKVLGYTDKDLDVLAGDLREKGHKVLNMREVERQTEYLVLAEVYNLLIKVDGETKPIKKCIHGVLTKDKKLLTIINDEQVEYEPNQFRVIRKLKQVKRIK